jgi:parallel beta-helix repeat protein
VGTLDFMAVISVVNTSNVTIYDLAIDASKNTVSGCTVAVAGIHFYNASGVVDNDAISGTQLSNPLSCTTLFPGNGFGVQVDETASSTASFTVKVRNTSVHDFGRNGILVVGAGETANIDGNSIAGVGPSTGVNQFGIFLADGATGQVTGNSISQGNCGTITIPDCFTLRSEGVVLRSVGNGTVVAGNMISNVQAGVFVNGATGAVVTGNTISNVDALDGIHIQGSISGLFTGNRIFHVGPFTTDTSNDEGGCGINDVSGSGSSENTILANSVNDSYCGVGYVTSDQVQANTFLNTLYETLNGDNYPNTFPPPVEP